MSSHPIENAASLHRAGKLKAALRQYLAHLQARPKDAEVHHTVGGLHHQMGDTQAATKAFQRAVELAPENPDYLNDLGAIWLARKHWDKAEQCFRAALALAPDYTEVRNNLGHALTGAGQIGAAIDCFQQITTAHPEFVDAHFNLGRLLQQQGLLEIAAHAYETAVRLRPELAIAHYHLGEVYAQLGQKERAIRCLNRALQLAPDLVNAKLALAEILTESARANEALPILQDLVHANPDSIEAAVHLGRAYEVCGDLTAAENVYRRATSQWPSDAGPWVGLASCKRFSAHDRADIDRLEALIQSGEFEAATLSHLHFAAGKMLDDCQEYDLAFAHYRAGNESRRARITYDATAMQGHADAINQTFDSEYLKLHAALGNESELPVFIVGMPRSGTTLVEQIIASHPQAHGAGELHYIAQVAAGMHVLLGTGTEQRFPEIFSQLNSVIAAQIIEPYLALLRWHSPSATRVADKMPTNFRYLGLIATLFPKARIIHCERDPMDTCLSIYFQDFENGHQYAFDLADVGNYYRRHYQRLMKHWQSVLPGRIYTCNYERLIADPETQARALIAACGLPWNDACLEFHANKQQVRTASIAQVREGIYTRSKQRWRHYDKHLGPLKKALGLDDANIKSADFSDDCEPNRSPAD